MVLELEVLGCVVKRTKRKCPVDLEVQLLGSLIHKLEVTALIADCCVCSYSAITTVVQSDRE